MGDFKFRKQNRLSGKTEIENLFSHGSSFNLPVIRVVYLEGSSSNNKVLFTVPSKVFKRATDRNLLKRRMRESFRLNQSKFQIPVKLSLAYIYIAKKVQPYSEIEKSIIKSFKKLLDAMES